MAKIVGTTQFMNEKLQDEIPIFKKVRTYVGTNIYMELIMPFPGMYRKEFAKETYEE